MAAAREMAAAATEGVRTTTPRIGEAMEAAAQLAVGAERGVSSVRGEILRFPALVRSAVQRPRDLLESTGRRALVAAIRSGTRVLNATTAFVDETVRFASR